MNHHIPDDTARLNDYRESMAGPAGDTRMITPPTPTPSPAPRPEARSARPDQRPDQKPPLHPLIARGLIRDEEGRWLVVHPRDGHHWHLPGGKVKQNESITEACAREIREELALELTPDALIAVGWTASRRAGRKARVTFIFDMGSHPAPRLASTVVLQQSELTAWRWAEPREALTILHPDTAARLAKYPYQGGEPTAVFTQIDRPVAL